MGPSSLSCPPALRAPAAEAARLPEQRGPGRAWEAGSEQGWAGSPPHPSVHPARAGASDPNTAWPRRAWHTCAYTCVCALMRVCPAAPADSLRAGIWTSPSPQASPSPGQGPPLALQTLSQPSSQASPQRWADPGPVDLWGQEGEAQMDRDAVCQLQRRTQRVQEASPRAVAVTSCCSQAPCPDLHRSPPAMLALGEGPRA